MQQAQALTVGEVNAILNNAGLTRYLRDRDGFYVLREGRTVRVAYWRPQTAQVQTALSDVPDAETAREALAAAGLTVTTREYALEVSR